MLTNEAKQQLIQGFLTECLYRLLVREGLLGVVFDYSTTAPFRLLAGERSFSTEVKPIQPAGLAGQTIKVVGFYEESDLGGADGYVRVMELLLHFPGRTLRWRSAIESN